MLEMNSFVLNRFNSIFYFLYVAYTLSVACTGTQQLNFLTSLFRPREAEIFPEMLSSETLDERDILRKWVQFW